MAKSMGKLYSTKLPNRKLPCDSNNGVLGKNLSRCTWSTLNKLRKSHSQCGHLLHKWGFQDNPVHDYGNGEQTIDHIVVDCQGKKFSQGFEGLNVVSLF